MAETDAIPLKEHLLALREADLRRLEDLRKADQRALQIKEAGDAKALDLARQIQDYKDEKGNELREQINSERHLYVTQAQLAAAVEKVEAMIVPLAAYVAAQQGKIQGINWVASITYALIGAAAGAVVIAAFFGRGGI